MNKKRLALTIIEALSGVLGVIALIGNFAVDTKEIKEISKIGVNNNESSED